MIITNEMAQALRVKRAKLSLTKDQARKELGVSFVTYKRLETGNWNANQSIYEKVTNWLVKDY